MRYRFKIDTPFARRGEIHSNGSIFLTRNGFSSWDDLSKTYPDMIEVVPDVWPPERLQKVWLISATMVVESALYSPSDNPLRFEEYEHMNGICTSEMLEVGNIFKTKEKAERVRDRFVAILKEEMGGGD